MAVPKKPQLAAIQNHPWIKTYSIPGEGCERMPDGTYCDYGFHSEMLEEDYRRTDVGPMRTEILALSCYDHDRFGFLLIPHGENEAIALTRG